MNRTRRYEKIVKEIKPTLFLIEEDEKELMWVFFECPEHGGPKEGVCCRKARESESNHRRPR